MPRTANTEKVERRQVAVHLSPEADAVYANFPKGQANELTNQALINFGKEHEETLKEIRKQQEKLLGSLTSKKAAQ